MPAGEEDLRERLSRLVEASRRINESLEFEAVLQGVMDSAESLTGARFGVMLLYDDKGWIVDFVGFGGTRQQAEEFWTMPEAMRIHKYLSKFEESLRIGDFNAFLAERGVTAFNPPFPVSPVITALVAPMHYRGERLGVIYLADRAEDTGGGFTSDDEEFLMMFASQAALVISNARRHREEQRARGHLEALVNAAAVAVLVFDAETRALVSANREARRMAGDLLPGGGSVMDLLDSATILTSEGRRVRRGDLPAARVLRTGEAVRADEMIVEAPGGRRLTVLVNATPIIAEGGAVESVLVTAQDMTPLAELDRLRAEFLGMVGHELRTPLTSIKGSAANLLETESSLDRAEMTQYHRIINEQADYMRDLISDLIDVVRIETGTLSVAVAPTDAARLVDEARNVSSGAGGRDNIRVTIAPDLPAVMADRRRAVQVLNNLLANASRNSHETSAIRVGAALDGAYVAFSVADSGRGVLPERLPFLFEKFSRHDGPDRTRDLGLGLAICKGIVEAHGGRIWAESDGPGLGSRFTFTLPVTDEHPARPGRAATGRPRVDRAGAAGPRVLAVDDDPRTLKVVRDALADAGFDPIVTGDPDEAAALMEEAAIDVVLLDMMLPDCDGIDLMRDVFARHDAPVIFLSAYDQRELIVRAFEMGAVDYIAKPFSPSELAARVKAALRKQPDPQAPFTLGDLAVDYARRTVTVAGRPVDLTPTEYRLLTELSTNAGTALTHDQLFRKAWAPGRTHGAASMRTVVKNLRNKLGDQAHNSRYVQTVPHIGYRMPLPDPTP